MKTVTLKFFMAAILVATLAGNAFSLCTDDGRVSAVFEKPNVAEQRVVSVSYSTYRAKYDQLWNQGWRLHDLNVHYSYGTPRYSAVWRPGTMGEYQIYDADYTQLRNYYSPKYQNGWRIHTISSYYDMKAQKVKYSFSFRQTNAPEYVLYGWKMGDVINEYNRIKGNNWRIRLLNSYNVNGTLLYNVVFEQSTSGESVILGYGQNDFANKFNTMKNQGWHLEVLDTYYTTFNGGILYSATFRPGLENEIVVANLYQSQFTDNYYFSTGYSAGWRMDQISFVCFAAADCDDVIFNPVNEKVAFFQGEEANSDDFSSPSSLDNAVLVYPTSSSTGQFTLQIDNISGADSGELEIFDITGARKDIANKDIRLGDGTQEFNLDLNGYGSGAYFVKVRIGEAVITKRVFIVE